MHNLCCDNCHSHVARALNLMQYDGSTRFFFLEMFGRECNVDSFSFNLSWNMVTLCALMLVHGRHVSWLGMLRTWLPSLILLAIVVALVVLTHPAVAPV